MEKKETEQPEPVAKEPQVSAEELKYKISELTSLLSTLDTQIEDACSNDDFEEADRL